MRTLTALVASLCIVTVACTTPYQPKGFTGGYSERRLDTNTFRVDFQGNGYTPRETVDTYLLRRCAELTVQNGYDYFIVIDGDSEARTGVVTTPGTFSAHTTYYGNTANTTGYINPGQTFHFRKYGGMAMIKMFKGEKPVDHLAAYNAKDMLQYIGADQTE